MLTSTLTTLPNNYRTIHYDESYWPYYKRLGVQKLAVTNNVVWAGGNGIYRFDGENWLHYPLKDVFPNDYVLALAADSDQSVWIATQTGVANLDHGIWITDTRYSDLPKTDSCGITIAKDKSLWLARGWAGLTQYDGKEWINSGLQSAFDVEAALQGGVWVSSLDITYINHDNSKKYNLQIGDFIKQIKSAPDNSIWLLSTHSILAHFKDGVISEQYNYFEIPHWNIRSIGVASDGTLWLGSQGEGWISSFDGKTWTLYDGLPFNTVFDFAFDTKGLVWLATERGVYQFRPFYR